MTSETKTKDTKTLHKDLREHYLAEGIYILPQRKEVTQIMELRFTPEEAELALSIPMQALAESAWKPWLRRQAKGKPKCGARWRVSCPRGLSTCSEAGALAKKNTACGIGGTHCLRRCGVMVLSTTPSSRWPSSERGCGMPATRSC